MDKFEKSIVYSTMLLVVVMVLCILFAKDFGKIDVPECIPYDSKYMNPKVEQLDNSTIQVFYVAGMWSFEPNVLKVNKGTTIDFYLASKDVVHGFKIGKTNINLMAVPGNINKFTYSFNHRGTFEIVCHEYCGAYHQNMMGQIIVQ